MPNNGAAGPPFFFFYGGGGVARRPGGGEGARGRAPQQSPAARGRWLALPGAADQRLRAPPPGFGPVPPPERARARHARRRTRGTPAFVIAEGNGRCAMRCDLGRFPERARAGVQAGTGGLDGYRGGAARSAVGSPAFRGGLVRATADAAARTDRWRVLRARASTRRRGGRARARRAGPADGRACTGARVPARARGARGEGIDWRMAAAM